MRKKTTLLITIILVIFTTTNTFGQLVTSGADDGSDGTLRQEIADTPAGGEITFSGVTEVILNSELIIDKEITITGTTTVINANSNGRIFNVSAGPLTLNSLTLTNGLAVDGGAIYMTNASVTVNNCILTNNTANGASGS